MTSLDVSPMPMMV